MVQTGHRNIFPFRRRADAPTTHQNVRMPSGSGCFDATRHGIFGIIPIWGVEGFGLLLSICILTIFLYRRYTRENKSDYYSSDQRVLFPVHLYLLAIYNFASIFQTSVLAFLLSSGINNGQVWAVGNELSWGFNHAFIGQALYILS